MILKANYKTLNRFILTSFCKLIIYEYYPMLAAHNYRKSKSSNYKIKKSN